MKRLIQLFSLFVALSLGIYIGAGLGAAQQLRLDIARFSENVRGWHREFAGTISLTPGRVDGSTNNGRL